MLLGIDAEWSLWLTLLALMIFKGLEAGKGGTASDQLMRELGLVVGFSTLVDLLMSVLSFV